MKTKMILSWISVVIIGGLALGYGVVQGLSSQQAVDGISQDQSITKKSEDKSIAINNENDVAKDKENIVLIIADDLGHGPTPGYDTDGTKANMPNLEKMMSDGLTFDNVWATPMCSTTRGTLLTGKYGSNTGVLNTAAKSKVSTSETSLHRHLQESQQYANSIIGKWHLSGRDGGSDYPNQLGVDHYAGVLEGTAEYNDWNLTINGETEQTDEYITTKFTDMAIDWVDEQNTADDPWLFWLAYTAPHTPLHAPPSYMHSQGDLPTDDRSISQNKSQYFLAMVESLDYEIGRLIDSIPDDEMDNTTFIFIGDNGTGGQTIESPYSKEKSKGTLYQGGIHVPMVISGSMVDRKGEREDAMINSVDLFATISDIAGASNYEDIDGVSFVDMLSSGDVSGRDWLYSEILDGQDHNKTARNNEYKLIDFGSQDDELYNLLDDPYESNNLLQNYLSEKEQENYEELTEIINSIKK